LRAVSSQVLNPGDAWEFSLKAHDHTFEVHKMLASPVGAPLCFNQSPSKSHLLLLNLVDCAFVKAWWNPSPGRFLSA